MDSLDQKLLRVEKELDEVEAEQYNLSYYEYEDLLAEEGYQQWKESL